MLIRLETLYRNKDDALVGLAQLVNLDHVVYANVEASPSDESMMLLVKFAGSPDRGRYYFGPLDMTDDEVERRLMHIQTAPARATNTSWSRSADLAARRDSSALPIG